MKCVMGHEIEPGDHKFRSIKSIKIGATDLVSTSVGVVCAEHIPAYREAVQAVMEESGGRFSAGTFNKRVRATLAGNKSSARA